MLILRNLVNPVKLTVEIQAIINQFFRVVIVENSCCRSFSEVLQQILRFVRDAASTSQTPNNLSLIVRNRELVERSHRTGDEQHDIARSHQHDVSPFQPKSCEDQRVTRVSRQLVKLAVFAFVASRRDSDMKRTSVVSSLSNDINNARSRAGKKHNVLACDRLCEALGPRYERVPSLEPRALRRRRSHNSDFDSHISHYSTEV